MSLATCRECNQQVSTEARLCPQCGAPRPSQHDWNGTGIEWKSKSTLFGYPLVHIAFGRNQKGKLRVAKGIVAIGQFAIGAITVAQFGIGILFGFGQFLAGIIIVAQFAGAFYFGLGQFATGYVAIGQFVVAYYGLAQAGMGLHIWSVGSEDPIAVDLFKQLWESVQSYLSGIISK